MRLINEASEKCHCIMMTSIRMGFSPDARFPRDRYRRLAKVLTEDPYRDIIDIRKPLPVLLDVGESIALLMLIGLCLGRYLRKRHVVLVYVHGPKPSPREQ